MTTDYNQGRIAEQYQEAKRQPWRERIEAYSLMQHVGDLAGKRVVDIACGEGHFTRRLKQAGAAEVVGVDLSERMIELARQQEAADPLGIEYRVADARDLVSQQNFDLAVSAWLLVYAHDREELAQMCRGLACWIRPGGRFVTFTTNPELYHFPSRSDYRKYGFEVQLAEQVSEGAPILWQIQLKDSVLEIENYYLPMMAYQDAFRQAGFSGFEIHRPQLAPALADCALDREFWSGLIEAPPAILFDCVRNAGG